MYNVSEIIERIKELRGIKTDIALAEIFGVTKGAVMNWKMRNSIDVLAIAERFPGIDLNYVVYGTRTDSVQEPQNVVHNVRTSNDNRDGVFRTQIKLANDKAKLYEMEIQSYKDQIKELKILLAENKEVGASYKSNFLFQQERIKQLEERIESMQNLNTETVNDNTVTARLDQGSSRTLTIEKIKNRDTPAMV